MSLRKRSQSRVLALQALCVFDALGERFDGDLDGFLRDGVNYTDLGWQDPPEPELLALAREMARGAWQLQARCDELLRQHVPGWSVQRMQPVDRNILRLGLYELLECPGTPPQVVISEAVELARRFGGTDSPAFVNGVLDGVRRGLLAAGADAGQPGAAAPPVTPTTPAAAPPPAEDQHGSV